MRSNCSRSLTRYVNAVEMNAKCVTVQQESRIALNNIELFLLVNNRKHTGWVAGISLLFLNMCIYNLECRFSDLGWRGFRLCRQLSRSTADA